jgi:hypothetical protein
MRVSAMLFIGRLGESAAEADEHAGGPVDVPDNPASGAATRRCEMGDRLFRPVRSGGRRAASCTPGSHPYPGMTSSRIRSGPSVRSLAMASLLSWAVTASIPRWPGRLEEAEDVAVAVGDQHQIAYPLFGSARSMRPGPALSSNAPCSLGDERIDQATATTRSACSHRAAKTDRFRASRRAGPAPLRHTERRAAGPGATECGVMPSPASAAGRLPAGASGSAPT